MLSRHGSRYPTTGADVVQLGEKFARAKGKFKASGELEFLNNWKYQLGEEILVPRGENSHPLETNTDSQYSHNTQVDKNYSNQVTFGRHPVSGMLILTPTKVFFTPICMLACTTPIARSSSVPQ